VNVRHVIALLAAGTGLMAVAAENPRAESEQRTPLQPPIPPARKPPTELFRELLAAPPEERERQLAARPPAARELITSKLREFEALPPNQRELRLRVAELQFYLSPLLAAEPDDRIRLLAAIPQEVRPLLEERLRAWDQLTAEQRRDLLDSERSLSFFVRLQTTDPGALTNALTQVPASQRTAVGAQWARWQALSPEERARKTADFQRFFALDASEQEKVLGMISSAERAQMERTLARFGELPPDQRERAIRGFRKFLGMTPEQRAEFLQNAAKWQAMTPAERDTWRRVVERVTTPLPMPPERGWSRQLVMTNSPGRRE